MNRRLSNLSQSSWWASRFGWLLIGFASLLWFLIRSGPKPSRAAYPCQRMASANAALWLSTIFVPLVAVGRNGRRFLWLICVLATVGFFIASEKNLNNVSSLASFGAGTSPGETRLPLKIEGREATGPRISTVYASRAGTDAETGFARLIDLMEKDGQSFYARDGVPGIVADNDVVIIKVNSQWDSRGGTNSDLVAAIVKSIVVHPDGFEGEIVIADNGQAQYGSRGKGGSLDWERNNAVNSTQSYLDVARGFSAKHRVSTYLWDSITLKRVGEYADGDDRDGYIVADTPSSRTGIIVSYPKFKTLYGTKVSFAKGIWNGGVYDSSRLKIINVPVLKSHFIYGTTGAVKHYMGVVSNRLTRHNAHRKVGTGGMGTQMAQTRVPDLNVLDAIWVNARPNNGPSTSYDEADLAGIIAAGRDPVALDAWGATEILMQSARLLGYENVTSMDPRSRAGGSFGHWLSLSMDELRRAGFNVTNNADEIRVLFEEVIR